MRRIDGRLGRRPTSRLPPTGDAPSDPGCGSATVGGPRSLSPDELRARAQDVLDRLCALEREMLDGRTPEIRLIDAIATSVCDLQSAITDAPASRFRSDGKAELRRAQRCISEALVLTIDLLARSPEL